MRNIFDLRREKRSGRRLTNSERRRLRSHKLLYHGISPPRTISQNRQSTAHGNTSVTPAPPTLSSCLCARCRKLSCLNLNSSLRRAWKLRGSRDVIGDKTVATLKEALSGGESSVEVRAFAESGHLAHLDEREEYLTVRVGERFMPAQAAASGLIYQPQVCVCAGVVAGERPRGCASRQFPTQVAESLLRGVFFFHSHWMG